MPRGLMTKARDAQKNRLYAAELAIDSAMTEDEKASMKLISVSSQKDLDLIQYRKELRQEAFTFVTNVKKIVLEKFRVKIYDRPINILVDCDEKGRNIFHRGLYGLFSFDRWLKNPYTPTTITLYSKCPHKRVLLHEIAHWIHMGMFPTGNDYLQMQPHGAEYAAIYIWLTHEILGNSFAVNLYKALKKEKVAVDEAILRMHGLATLLHYV